MEGLINFSIRHKEWNGHGSMHRAGHLRLNLDVETDL